MEPIDPWDSYFSMETYEYYPMWKKSHGKPDPARVPPMQGPNFNSTYTSLNVA